MEPSGSSESPVEVCQYSKDKFGVQGWELCIPAGRCNEWFDEGAESWQVCTEIYADQSILGDCEDWSVAYRIQLHPHFFGSYPIFHVSMLRKTDVMDKEKEEY